MPGDFEYSAKYTQAITNAGGTVGVAPIDLKETIRELGTLIGTGNHTPTPTVTTPTIANSATGVQLSTTADVMLYLEVGTAGTAMVIKIGPTSSPANTVHASGTATSGDLYTIRVPAGWFVSTTYTTATIANQLAITC